MGATGENEKILNSTSDQGGTEAIEVESHSKPSRDQELDELIEEKQNNANQTEEEDEMEESSDEEDDWVLCLDSEPEQEDGQKDEQPMQMVQPTTLENPVESEDVQKDEQAMQMEQPISIENSGESEDVQKDEKATQMEQAAIWRKTDESNAQPHSSTQPVSKADSNISEPTKENKLLEKESTAVNDSKDSVCTIEGADEEFGFLLGAVQKP